MTTINVIFQHNHGAQSRRVTVDELTRSELQDGLGATSDLQDYDVFVDDKEVVSRWVTPELSEAVFTFSPKPLEFAVRLENHGETYDFGFLKAHFHDKIRPFLERFAVRKGFQPDDLMYWAGYDGRTVVISEHVRRTFGMLAREASGRIQISLAVDPLPAGYRRISWVNEDDVLVDTTWARGDTVLQTALERFRQENRTGYLDYALEVQEEAEDTIRDICASFGLSHRDALRVIVVGEIRLRIVFPDEGVTQHIFKVHPANDRLVETLRRFCWTRGLNYDALQVAVDGERFAGDIDREYRLCDIPRHRTEHYATITLTIRTDIEQMRRLEVRLADETQNLASKRKRQEEMEKKHQRVVDGWAKCKKIQDQVVVEFEGLLEAAKAKAAEAATEAEAAIAESAGLLAASEASAVASEGLCAVLKQNTVSLLKKKLAELAEDEAAGAPLGGAAPEGLGDCCMCLEALAAKTHLMRPCGHTQVCPDCINDVVARPCPICREEVIEVLAIH
jgi:hypothetical protein